MASSGRPVRGYEPHGYADGVLRRPLSAAVVTTVVLAFAACGGGEETGAGSDDGGPGSARFAAVIDDARDVEASDFPAPGGRSLQEIAADLPAVQLGLATSVFTPGENRLAFGVIDDAQKFVYGKSAVYVSRTPQGKALGPYPAPADPLVVDAPFRSRGAAEGSDEISAIYEADVPLPGPGRWSVLAVTRNQGRLFGAGSQVEVSARDSIPAVGEEAPKVTTDTLASAGGDIDAIDTRVPPSDLHERSFDDVVGEKPVALLFATPALCQTRVCGPVVDIAAQMEKTYGDRMEFIHQEVYVENTVEKGLRPPLEAFNLRTEPWLFTVDADGKVAARLEGSFGNGAFERAIEAAL